MIMRTKKKGTVSSKYHLRLIPQGHGYNFLFLASCNGTTWCNLVNDTSIVKAHRHHLNDMENPFFLS
jgi:hypothetical protein